MSVRSLSFGSLEEFVRSSSADSFGYRSSEGGMISRPGSSASSGSHDRATISQTSSRPTSPPGTPSATPYPSPSPSPSPSPRGPVVALRPQARPARVNDPSFSLDELLTPNGPPDRLGFVRFGALSMPRTQVAPFLERQRALGGTDEQRLVLERLRAGQEPTVDRVATVEWKHVERILDKAVVASEAPVRRGLKVSPRSERLVRQTLEVLVDCDGEHAENVRYLAAHPVSTRVRVTDVAPSGITWNADGRLVSWNPAGAFVPGAVSVPPVIGEHSGLALPPQVALGTLLASLVPPAVRPGEGRSETAQRTLAATPSFGMLDHDVKRVVTRIEARTMRALGRPARRDVLTRSTN